MKSFLAIALALMVALTLPACTASASGSASASTDASTATDASAAPASGDFPVYPGATPAEKSSYGTPPPGGKLYSTTDDPVTVSKWYLANVTGIKEAAPTTAKGGMLAVGDQTNGTFVTLIAEDGKTYIQILPAAAMK